MARYFIGLDAGSSVCKAAVFDLKGHQLVETSRPTPLERPKPGWSELDANLCWQVALAVIKEAVMASGVEPDAIAGLGLSAAMVGAWVVNARGEALRPGILWEDSRSQSIINTMLARDPDLLSHIFAESGSVLQQGCTLPLMAWLAQYEPEILQSAEFVLSYKDFLRLKLTGMAATDRSEAAVLPGNAACRDRSDSMIALFGLESWRHLLPPVYEAEEFISTLLPSVARLLDLPASLPVAVGAGDVAATLTGAGALRSGSVMAVLGTTALLGVCHDRPVFKPRNLGLLFSLPGSLWYRAMVNVAGTLNLDWAINAFAADFANHPECYQRASELAKLAPAGANGLIYLPYLSESGIIAPCVNPLARAQFCGLSPRHGRDSLFRAVFEAVAFALKDLLEMLDFSQDRAEQTPILLTGGGARNSFWAQMIADIVEWPITVPEPVQFGARGAALLAATAAGDFSDIRQASQSIRDHGVTYQPDSGMMQAYRQAHGTYCYYRDRLLMQD